MILIITLSERFVNTRVENYWFPVTILSMQEAHWQEVAELDAAHVTQLTALYARQWWSAARSEPDVRRMLAQTPVVIGMVAPDTGRLAAFCRALSDGVYRATVYDVIVDEAFQGTGLGRRLMDALLAHPLMKDVQRVELVCHPELVPFYETWGFGTIPPDWHMLIRTTSRDTP
ncbi:MAG: GNAT family N-acetyltransferase [Nitrospirota bacterium]|nr:GNAT family N-acetyltransferase [Nitrospirota bacterium]